MELKDKMEYIIKCIQHIDSLREQYGADKIVKTFLTLTSTLYTLQTAIQALIDMGLRFLAEIGRKPPQQYSDIGVMLEEENIFTKSDSDLFRRIVGFRNILVHRYLGVDLELLREILQKELYRDISKLAFKILKVAEERGVDP